MTAISDTIHDLQRRLAALERTTVRHRAGEVTGTGPLDVALGASSVSHENVSSLTPAAVGVRVEALVFGNDLLVLGEIGDGSVHWVGGGGEPGFANSWVNYDANRPAGFYRAHGRVWLTGMVKSGTVGQAAFTLPAGYLPLVGSGAALPFGVVSNNAFGEVDVYSDGRVIPSVGSNTWVSLEGVSFVHA